MPKFKVGDRVKCIAAHDGNKAIVGQKGTVRWVGATLGIVSVEFDNDVHGHALQSPYRCECGHGWNINASKLELIPKPDPKHALKIIIYRQGNKVFVKYVVDKRVAAETCATCSPEDTFSFITGAQLAFARFVQQYDAKPVLLKETLKNIEII
jgi:hypothetical protein